MGLGKRGNHKIDKILKQHMLIKIGLQYLNTVSHMM